MVINHLLNGMILQAENRPKPKKGKESRLPTIHFQGCSLDSLLVFGEGNHQYFGSGKKTQFRRGEEALV